MRWRTITIADPQQQHCSLGRSLNGGCMPGVQGVMHADGKKRRFALFFAAGDLRRCTLQNSAPDAILFV